MAVAARGHKGGAKPTTLSGSLTNVATSFTVTTGGGTGFPDGSTGVFVVTLDSGLAGEEKVLCSSRSGDTFTVSTRGYDDTVASAHANLASVTHTYSAIEAQEANNHLADTTRDDHTQYAKRGQGLASGVGAASRAGRLYIATDTEDLYADDGGAVHRYLSKPSADAAYVAKASTLELAEVTRNTLLALTAATDTAIPWVSATASAGFDTTVWSSGAATRLTIPAAQGGVYQVTAMLPFDVVGAAGQVRLTVKQNGGAIAADQRSVNANDVALATVTALPRRFAAGDYIEVFAYSSNARNVSSGFVMIPTLTVVRVGT